jgi:CBS domain containing-hemolysin-like protein
VIEFLVAVLLLIGNAFFVASEFALIAARRTVVEPLAEESRRARTALRAMNQIPLMIAGAQLGITLCSLGLGAIAEPALAHPLAAPFAAMGIPHGIVEPTAFVLALGIVVFFHTVLGEMVPKNLTLVGPERAALWLGAPMLAFCVATKPLLIAMKCGGAWQPGGAGTQRGPAGPGGARPDQWGAGLAEPDGASGDAGVD